MPLLRRIIRLLTEKNDVLAGKGLIRQCCRIHRHEEEAVLLQHKLRFIPQQPVREIPGQRRLRSIFQNARSRQHIGRAIHRIDDLQSYTLGFLEWADKEVQAVEKASDKPESGCKVKWQGKYISDRQLIDAILKKYEQQ